jgi:uncharacterized phiE125 gp8 family phage protein
MPYVITPPDPDTLPITVDFAKSHSRILQNAEDDLIETYIRASWEFAAFYQQRTLLPTTWGLDLDCWPKVIRLGMPPLRSATITYVDKDGSTQTLDSSQYVVDTNSEPGRIHPAYGVRWPSVRHQPKSITVTFSAGYDDPDSIPFTTQMGIVQVVAHMYENREAFAAGTLTRVPLTGTDLLDVGYWGNYS